MKELKKKPVCKLVGTDGNIFSLMGRVSACLRKNKLDSQIKVMMSDVTSSKSYHEALIALMKYVEIK